MRREINAVVDTAIRLTEAKFAAAGYQPAPEYLRVAERELRRLAADVARGLNSGSGHSLTRQALHAALKLIFEVFLGLLASNIAERIDLLTYFGL